MPTTLMIISRVSSTQKVTSAHITLSNTTSIADNYATFRLDDNVNFAQANRVNLSADITLKGGSLVYVGRAQTDTAQ